MEHLILTLEAPMMSFGTTLVDQLGPTGLFPGRSAMTGLIGNALGWTRTQHELLQVLQDNLTMAARLDRPPANDRPSMDYQGVKIDASDIGWTTSGILEGRSGGKQTLENYHLRFREYLADPKVTVAIRTSSHRWVPTMEEIAQALTTPARPLFIGRKPFIPSRPIYTGTLEAGSALGALLEACLEDNDPPDPHPPEQLRLTWPALEGPPEIPDIRISAHHAVADQRNWKTRLHSGSRMVYEGRAPRRIFPIGPKAPHGLDEL